jgi:hypothetical protein
VRDRKGERKGRAEWEGIERYIYIYIFLWKIVQVMGVAGKEDREDNDGFR